MRREHPDVPAKLCGLAAAHDFFAACFSEFDRARETLLVAHVDNQGNCLHLARFDGEPTSARFPIRSILADAIRHGSAGLILAHNHPSGDVLPSESDRRVTRRLVTAAEAMDCTVLDHLIFGGSEYSSLRKMGFL